MTPRKWIVVALGAVIAGAMLAAGSAMAAEATEAATGVDFSFKTAIDLLRAGGPYTVAVAAVWFALRKDSAATQMATAHATEMKEINGQLATLIAASTAAQSATSADVTALKDAILALERAWDRRP